jgi:hypothetical protein
LETDGWISGDSGGFVAGKLHEFFWSDSESIHCFDCRGFGEEWRGSAGISIELKNTEFGVGIWERKLSNWR